MKIISLLGGDEPSGYTWQLITAIYDEVDGLTLVSNSFSLSEGYHCWGDFLAFSYIYICSANSLYVLFTWLAWHLNPGESTWFFSKTPSCETWEWDFHWRSINEWSMVMVFRSQDFAEVGSVATWYIRLVSPTKGWLLEWAVFYYNNNNNNIHLFIIYLFWVFLSLSSVAVSGLNYCYIIISNSCELLISYSQVEY